MVNYGRKKCKICGGKLIKKGLDKVNNQFDIVSIVTDIMFLKEKTFMIDYESTDMIDFLLDNKKIKDFNVSKSTFYRKINKFC